MEINWHKKGDALLLASLLVLFVYTVSLIFSGLVFSEYTHLF